MKRKIGFNFRRNWRAVVGGVLFISVVLVSLFANFIAPYDPLEINLANCLRGPSFEPAPDGTVHIFGTDQLGRDVLSRIIFGGQTSLTVGLCAVALAGIIGVTLGMVAGFYGGWIDAVIMRLADIQLAIPSILLAIVMVAVTGKSLVNIVIVLAITGWVQFARVVRGNVLTIKEMEYIDAARCMGVSHFKILFRHIFPNVFFSVIIIATLQMARMILMEASLSFLGMGANISVPTWGNMISEGRNYITSAWWLCTVPGLVIVVVIIGINLLGDWLRDFLDPKLKF
ncbi:MAG: ABC transporter permease [Oscillospiraceae bacterium]